MDKAKVLRADECEFISTSWGNLTWFAAAGPGNSNHMTVGRCVIKPGMDNPLHHHPNCEEVLVVMQGRISHTIEGGKEVELNTGDTITLPINVPHRARNISDEDAVLFIAFSSAHREIVMEPKDGE